MCPKDVAKQYVAERRMSPAHARTLCARSALLSEFSIEAINALLLELEKSRSEWTCKGWRGDLLTLWRYAAELELAPWPRVRRIRQYRPPAPVVDCFSVVEASRIARHAQTLPGELGDGTPRRLYWPAIIRLAWDTGLRRSDLWRIRSDALRDGLLTTISGKSGQRTYHTLYSSTLAALLELDRPAGALLLPWPHARRTFVDHFAAIVTDSGVCRGTFRWLRRSSGSYVEAQQPGAGPRHLGHSSPATFYRHYDSRAVAPPSVRPPELAPAAASGQ